MFFNARRFFLPYFGLILALLIGCACYFAFSGTNSTEYVGEIGSPDSVANQPDTMPSPVPPVPESLEDDFDLLDGYGDDDTEPDSTGSSPT